MPTEIALSNGGITTIDDEDAELVLGRSWFGVQPGRVRYAASFMNGKQVLLHRVIMGAACAGLVVDHINFDGLDNRRANLRAVTSRENGRRKRKPITSTSSIYKGVTRDRSAGRRWLAKIRVGDKRYHLGSFNDPKKAAAAYNRVAARVFGPMALLNDLRP